MEKNMNKKQTNDISGVYGTNSALSTPWLKATKIPQRYNDDGSLAFIWVLVCLYDMKNKIKIAKVAKYEDLIGWLDDNDNLIENENRRVTHWIPLIAPPTVRNNQMYWGVTADGNINDYQIP